MTALANHRGNPRGRRRRVHGPQLVGLDPRTGLLLAYWAVYGGGWGLFVVLVVWLAIAIVTGVPAVRKHVITRPVMRKLGPLLPQMSETEAIRARGRDGLVGRRAVLGRAALGTHHALRAAAALGAGTRLPRRSVHSTLPHARRSCHPGGRRSPARRVELHQARAVMGMIIPEALGGLGFSAIAYSSVIAMLASRSAAACVTVMVPNSLGPAELLLRYGTDEQQRYYLPRLAVGEEDPMLRAHRAPRWLGRRGDSLQGHRVQGHVGGSRDHRPSVVVGQALHHARAGRDRARARVPDRRSRPPAR